jgi:hypothetical protein
MELKSALKNKTGEMLLLAGELSAAAFGLAGFSGCRSVPENTDGAVSAENVDDKKKERHISEIVPSANSEGIVIESGPVIHRFQGKDKKEYFILSDSEFKSSSDSQNTGKGVSLKGHVFYVGPRAPLDLSELERAYSKRAAVQIGTNQYEMIVMLPLLTDDVRQEAANALNKRFPQGGTVTKDQILLAPFRLLEMFKVIDGESVRIATWPNIPAGSKTVDVPDARPTIIPVRITGTEEELRQFVDNGRIDLRYHLGGFTIKQNCLDIVYEAIVNSELVNFLKGKTDWSEINRVRQSSGGGAASFGPITLGGSTTKTTGSVEKHSFVSRNQVKEIARIACERVKIHEYKEFKDENNTLDKFLDLLTARILSKMDKVDIQVKDDGTLMLGNELLKDIAPDVEKTIKQDLKTKTDAKDAKSIDVTYEKAKVGAKHSYSYLGDEDYKYENVGEKVVPKGVELHQANSASFKIDATLSLTQIEATPGQQPFHQTGTVIKATVSPAISAKIEKKTINDTYQIKGLDIDRKGSNVGTGSYRFNTGKPVLSTDKGQRVIVIPYDLVVYSNSSIRLASFGISSFGGGTAIRVDAGLKAHSSGKIILPINSPGVVKDIYKSGELKTSGHYGGKKDANDKTFKKDSKGTAITNVDVRIDSRDPGKGSVISVSISVDLDVETRPAKPASVSFEILPRD